MLPHDETLSGLPHIIVCGCKIIYYRKKYYPIEQVLGGCSMGLKNMYGKGLNKIIHIGN